MDELDALSVSVEDSDADTDAEQALFGEPGMPPPSAGWQRSTLKALFETEAAASEAATLLLAQDWATQPGASVSMTALHEVAEQDWVRLTQSQFDPVEITPDVLDRADAGTSRRPRATRVIRLDPGMAFGTGTHPTTRMCLGWIAAHEADIAGRRVLDYGCGSGILAIGAALHGGAPIDAVDIDPAAIATTAQNAADNGVTLRSGAPDMASRRVPAGAGQHPRDAAEDAGAAAVRPRRAGRPPGAGRHPRPPGRRAEGRLRAVDRAGGQPTRWTAGS